MPMETLAAGVADEEPFEFCVDLIVAPSDAVDEEPQFNLHASHFLCLA